ncbi:MAG: hypothetical protein ACK5B6_13695, partial [Bacteroidia bacterium]
MIKNYKILLWKQLISIFILILALNELAYAQTNDANPHVICSGSTKTYRVDYTENGGTGTTGSTYTWTINGAPNAVITSGQGSNNIVIDWGITPPNTYNNVISVVETNGGCSAPAVELSVTILNPIADDPADVSTCDSYILPPLSANNAYFTGPNGTGTQIAVGSEITSSQTVYVLSSLGTTPYICTDENSFQINITTSPVVTTPGNQTVCDSYTLPALSVGNYYTEAGGTGTQLAAGTSITATQTIYVYAANGTCTDEDNFTVTITTSPVVTTPGNQTVCDSYTLPALTVGNYYTEPGGTGTQLAAGASITSTQTIYVFAGTGTCTDEDNFTVTITTSPVVTTPGNQTVCDSYTLPALSVGNYYTEPGGTGTQLAAGALITSTQTIY